MKETAGFVVCALAVCVVWMGIEMRKITYQIRDLNEQIYQFEEIFELSVRVGE